MAYANAKGVKRTLESMAWLGRSRIQGVGSLECYFGETGGHEGNSGEKLIRANAHRDQAGT